MGSALSSFPFTRRDKERENFVFICNEPENCLHFEPSQSYSVSYGLRLSENQGSDQLCRSEEGARRVSSAFVDRGVIPAENSLLFLQSRRSDVWQCTFEGMEWSFKEQAKNVGKNGIFVYIFSGHGSQRHRALIPLDCGGDRTLVTAPVLSRWLREAECKAKCILFVINCCYAGEIAEATVKEADNFVGASRLHVMAACSANEQAVTVPSLGCSTYCYFLSHAIRRARFPSGQFPVKTIHETCKKLTVALTSLLITSQEDRGELFPETMHPQLTHSTLHHVVMELSGEGKEQTDAKITHFVRIMGMYDSSKPRIPLAERSVAWIEGTQPALTVLKEGLTDLDSHTLAAILLSMLYSVAHLQMTSDPSTAVSANLFLTTYCYVASLITTIFQDVEFDMQLAAKGLYWYIHRLLQKGYKKTDVDRAFASLSKLVSKHATIDKYNIYDATDTDQRPGGTDI